VSLYVDSVRLFFLLYLSFVYAAIEINFSMNKVDYYLLNHYLLGKVGAMQFSLTGDQNQL